MAWRSQQSFRRQVFLNPAPLDVSPLFLLVLPEDLINFHKQIPPQEQIPARVYLGRVTLVTLSPGRPFYQAWESQARVGN